MAIEPVIYQSAIDDIRKIIRQGRDQAYQAVNAAQVLTTGASASASWNRNSTAMTGRITG